MHSQPDAPSTFPLPCIKSIPNTHTHSRPNAHSTFPLPRIKSIPDIHTHSRPDVFRPSLLCVKSIPDVSLVSRLQSGEARLHTSLARCILVRLSSLSIYMFLSCPLYVPLSHHSLPSACFLCLILSSLSLSTLVSSIFIPYLRRPYFSYSVHSL